MCRARELFSVQHAKYGSDGTSTFQLWKSTNSGSTWTQVGSTVTTSSTTLTTATFTVNSSVATRFELRKISGGTNRINFDSISITDYGDDADSNTDTAAAFVERSSDDGQSVKRGDKYKLADQLSDGKSAIRDVVSPR